MYSLPEMQHSPQKKPLASAPRAERTTREAARERVGEARREVYRQLIVDAAEGVFAEQGFAAAKMSDIAREAGVAMKTLYAAFPGKAELYHHIHELRCQEMLAAATKPSAGTALNAVQEHVRATVSYFLEHPNFLRTHLREGNAWAVGPALKDQPEIGLWQKNMELGAEIVQRGIDDGVFFDEDPALMTKMTTAVFQVHLADWLDRQTAGGQPEDSTQLVARIQEHIGRLLLRDR